MLQGLGLWRRLQTCSVHVGSENCLQLPWRLSCISGFLLVIPTQCIEIGRPIIYYRSPLIKVTHSYIVIYIYIQYTYIHSIIRVKSRAIDNHIACSIQLLHK